VARYILKRHGPFACAIEAVAALKGITVLDSVTDVALLVETDPVALERHRAALDGWVAYPQTSYRRPASEP
jgi:hypothetical protein